MAPKSNYGLAMGMAGQMLGTIVLGVFVGDWLDSAEPSINGQLWGGLVGTVLATLLVVRQARKNQGS
jgi:F0F1-type ATP synthase assembly protein I